MTKWHVKELAQLSGISVQTLHYYDRIALLKPSMRALNGYRTYSESDLLRLQQIVALKYFGIELAQINSMLSNEASGPAVLARQANILEQKAKSLLRASEVLNGIVSAVPHDKSIPWKSLIEIIEVYRMVEKLESSWAGKALNPDEIAQYARFEKITKERFIQNPKAKIDFMTQRKRLVHSIEAALESDPCSTSAQEIGKQWMDMINPIFGPENANLKLAIWQKGYKANKRDDECALDPKVVQWLDKAVEAYYRAQIIRVLAQVGKTPDEAHAQEWHALIDEMCGDSDEIRRSVYEDVINHPDVSPEAKKWLQSH